MNFVHRSFILTLLGCIVYLGWPLSTAVIAPRLYDQGVSLAEPIEPADAQGLNRLSYPALGLETPTFLLPNTNPFSVLDWEELRKTLEKGTATVFEGSDFAQSKNAYVIGHSSDVKRNPYAHVFAGLGQSEVGDSVALFVDGHRYDYKVIAKELLSPNDVSSFRRLEQGSGDRQRLLLVTCWPIFTTKNRMVIVMDKK